MKDLEREFSPASCGEHNISKSEPLLPTHVALIIGLVPVTTSAVGSAVQRMHSWRRVFNFTSAQRLMALVSCCN